MIIKRLLFSGIIFIGMSGVVTGQIQDQHSQKALDFMKSLTDLPPGVVPEHLSISRVWSREGRDVLRLASFEERGGFILYPADELPFQVVAFSADGFVTPNDLPPAMEWYVELVADQLIRLENLHGETSLDQTTQATTPVSGVTPLLSSRWDQRCYYNDSCPADPVAPAYYCVKAPAGCVATTLAQIMKYHKWPLQGTGSKSYYSIKYGTLSANFGATGYSISTMPDEIFASHPGVAQLIWHAGVASQMNYGPFASGTGIQDARSALVNYFGYKSSAQIVSKNSFSDIAWKALMRSEIDLGRPVFYSGVDQPSSTGHAWVLDGYSGTDYFHFNWGWSGVADGYFLMTSLNPLGSANYTSFQEAIIQIEPQGSAPLAAFTADTTMITHGSHVLFTDLSLGAITSWQWEFPGGVPSVFSGKNPPQIVYSSSGVYDVRLITANGAQSDTVVKKSYIRVLPLALFSASTLFTEVGGSVVFSDKSLSGGVLQSYSWHFFGGSPGFSVQKNPPPVTYHQPGQYAVLLTVNDGQHTDKHLAVQYITVFNQCDTLLNFFMPGWSVQAVNQPAFQVYQEDLDGLTPYHYQYISSGWDYFSEGGGANQFVSATSLFQTPGIANNWLIFGPVALPASGAVLQWKHKFPDHTKRDGYEILLSTTGNTHQHFTAPPLFALGDNDAQTLGDTVWKLRSVSIDPAVYGGQSVYVAVHHYANNMFYIGLDDFRMISCDGFPLTADFFSFDTIVSAGDSIMFYDFSSGEPDQLIWNFPGGVQLNTDSRTPLVRYDQPGTYDVSLTAWYGNTSNTMAKPSYISVQPASIQETGSRSVIRVFPNPARSELFVAGCPERWDYQITDPSGRMMRSGMGNGDQLIDVSTLPDGFWMITVRSHENVLQHKFVKE